MISFSPCRGVFKPSMGDIRRPLGHLAFAPMRRLGISYSAVTTLRFICPLIGASGFCEISPATSRKSAPRLAAVTVFIAGHRLLFGGGAWFTICHRIGRPISPCRHGHGGHLRGYGLGDDAATSLRGLAAASYDAMADYLFAAALCRYGRDFDTV